jgi:transposase
MAADRKEAAMYVEAHDTPEALADLIRSDPRARVARRLMAVRLAMLGRTAVAIAAEVLLSERQVYAWVARYNAEGSGGLADREGRGRKGPLSADDEERLKDRLRAGPTEADGACAFHGADVRRILRDEFGVVRSLQATYDLLHRLGFEPLRPRPRHPAADAPAQEAFKKAFPNASPRSRRRTRGSASRSGSKTRPASGRRGRWPRCGPIGAAGRRRRSRRPTATSTS